MTDLMTRVDLPDAWHVRTSEEFDDLFTSIAVDDVDPAFLASIAADMQPLIERSAEEGLVLLAGLFESIDPEPVDLDVEDLEVPFSADDIAPCAISAALALFHRERPEGTIEELLAALDNEEGRWLTRATPIDLPAGPAVVTREVQAVQPPSLKEPSDVLVITYYLLPTEAPDLIVVALFRTPSLGFATEFDEHFAAIAANIQIVPAEEAEAP